MASVSLKVRFEVLERDGFRCVYCGRAAVDGAELHVDHAISRRDGGGSGLGNLVTACVDCNLGKSGGSVTRRPITALVEGSISRTRLFVVTLGMYMGHSSYGASYRYMLRHGWPSEIMPPRAPRLDGRLWTQCDASEESRHALMRWYADEVGRILDSHR